MSLPPGFLDDLRTRTSLSRVVGRKVSWDQRKSNQGKGDFWAPCPFHQEKTASFHVDDQKGFYYCFGCHAKGDAISFVRETENVGFMEAIEILAREAGMTVPAQDPRARERTDKRDELAGVMEAATRHYRLQLSTAAGADARAYLDGRGLDAKALERWEIGFAPDTRQGLRAHLTGQGITDDQLVMAGLTIKPDDGGAPFDRFRGRIMFPIRDARGRAIAFGGRAMSRDARAKYLNSPETPLFDKGRSLFNQGPAREAAGKGQPLIVAEGYMDVIALSQAGFTATVAPLGTAITEDQLRMLWRIAPEPIVALDGDTAGLRAAQRLIDLALPLIEAGQSLRFVLLPQGLDPDDLIRSQGADAMQRLIDTARPMVDLLWMRETEGKVFDSPERRAALDRSLREAVKRIADPSIRGHYGQAIQTFRAALFAPPAPANQTRAGTYPPRGSGQRKGGNSKFGTSYGNNYGAARMPPSRGTALGAGEAIGDQLREAVILAIALTHPGVAARNADLLEAAEMSFPPHRTLLSALLQVLREGGSDAGDNDASQSLRNKVGALTGTDALDKLMAHTHVRIAPAIRRPDDGELAQEALQAELTWLAAQRGAAREVEDALADFQGMADEGLTWRLEQAAQARDSAQKPARTGDENAGEEEAALSRQLQNLIDNQVWSKKKR